MASWGRGPYDPRRAAPGTTPQQVRLDVFWALPLDEFVSKDFVLVFAISLAKVRDVYNCSGERKRRQARIDSKLQKGARKQRKKSGGWGMCVLVKNKRGDKREEDWRNRVTQGKREQEETRSLGERERTWLAVWDMIWPRLKKENDSFAEGLEIVT